MATEQNRTPLLPLTTSSTVRQTTVVLCNYNDMARLSKRTRSSGSGKTSVRMTIDIRATPLLANLNGAELGKQASAAIAALLTRQTQDIGAVASPSTIARRKRTAAAFRTGTPSGRDLARYTGGRTGPTIPDGTSVRLGNDSGRLGQGFFVTQNPKEGAWSINVPANRFDIRTWNGDAASLEAWIARFVSLVPALRDPRSILRDDSFISAVKAGAKSAVVKPAASQIKRWLAWVDAFNKGAGLGVEVLGYAVG